MASETKIGWTDKTFNPWRGCEKVAPECANCYAATFSKRTGNRHGQWGGEAAGGTRILAALAGWKEVEKWNRKCDTHTFVECVGCGHRSFLQHDQLETFCVECGGPEGKAARPRVFVPSMADVFEDWNGDIMTANDGRAMVERDGDWICGEKRGGDFSNMRPLTMNDLRKRLFELIDRCPNLDFQILTKRPENIRRMWPMRESQGGAVRAHQPNRDNVWLGTSAGTQATADRALPHLVKCRDLASRLFVSCEPMLESFDFGEWMFDKCHCYEHASPDPETGQVEYCSNCEFTGESNEPSFEIDWVIAGAESGSGRRPFDPQWVRDLSTDCRIAGVPLFVKQGSAFGPGQQADIPDDLWAIKEFPHETGE